MSRAKSKHGSFCLHWHLEVKTFELRQLVMFHHEKGRTGTEIANLLQMKKSTLGNITCRYKNEDRIKKSPQDISQGYLQGEKREQ